MSMFKKSKVEKAFADKKQRTKAEVDKDYSEHAIWHGHKSRMLAQIQQDVTRLEEEIAGHLNKLLVLNQEGMALPPESVPAPLQEVPPNETI